MILQCAGDIPGCMKRHPKTCHKFASKNECRFGNDCSYNHEESISIKEDHKLKEKVKLLEAVKKMFLNVTQLEAEVKRT